MSFKHGKNTEVWLKGLDISTYLRDMGFSVDVDTADSTTFKSDWKSALVGAWAAKLDFKGLYDPTIVGALEPLLGDAGDVITALPAGGAAIGDLAYLAQILSTAYAESSPVGDVVAFDWGVMADGTVGLGVVLHPLAAEAEDSSGTTTYHTGPSGGSANGGIAHLHVTGISAMDVLDVVIEDSSDHSAWAEIAGGATFTTVTAAGAQRLLIPGAIKRYTRISWDTGGDADPVTFSVALARL